jgi:Protein tyrosine phosphatase-like protein, PTPLA
MTTLMQVASRILLVWGIGYNFPQVVATSPAYSSMLFAWSVTEVVRYSYFVFFLGGGVPSWLSWLRWVYFSTCLARKRRARWILRDRAIGDLNTAVLEKAQAIEIAVSLGRSSLYSLIVLTIFLQIQHILRTLSSRCRKRNLVNLQGHRASLEMESTIRICSLGNSGDLRTR